MKLKNKKSGEEFSLSSIGISSGHGEFTRFTNEGSQVKITLKDSEGRIWKKDLSELMEEFKVTPEKAKTVFDLKEGDTFYMARTCCGCKSVHNIYFSSESEAQESIDDDAKYWEQLFGVEAKK